MIAVAAAGGLYLLNSVVYQPYADKLGAVEKQTAKATKEKEETDDLIRRKNSLGKVWKAMTTGGLRSDQFAAEQQADVAMQAWAEWAGVRLTDLKTEVPTDAGQFQVIGLGATVSGSTASVASMLQAIETSSVPIRVTEFKVTPRKEGTDELTLVLHLTTLCLKQDAATGKTAQRTPNPTEEAQS